MVKAGVRLFNYFRKEKTRSGSTWGGLNEVNSNLDNKEDGLSNELLILKKRRTCE